MVLLLTPWVWERLERFETGPDYRLPYQLSKDYWLYGRRVGQVVNKDKVLLLGDSVVWGEYVAPDGTLAHFLNEQAGATNRFVNLGINGLFPLAQEGLINYYGRSLRHEKILVQFNLLWLTSPKADLSSEKEAPFNHSRLVPQFTPRIPCYHADANERLNTIVQRTVPFLQWVGHIQNAYFDQKSILSWTLEEDGGSPPRYPNAYRNPLAANLTHRAVRSGGRSGARTKEPAAQGLVGGRARSDAIRMGEPRCLAAVARLPAAGQRTARARQFCVRCRWPLQ